MIYFLYGEDTYRSREKLKSIKEQYRAKHADGDIGIFDFFESSECDRCVDFIDTPSLFVPKKLVIILRPFEKVSADGLKRILSNKQLAGDSDRFLVLWGDNGKVPAQFKFLTEKPVAATEFEPLSKAQIRSWMLAHAKECGVVLDQALIAELAAVFGDDLWALNNEIQKLSCAGSSTVKPEDAHKISSYPGASSVFSCADKFWKKSSGLLEAFEQSIGGGDSAEHLAGLLISQSRIMLHLKNGLSVKGNPYYIRNLTALGGQVHEDDLVAIHKKFAQAESAVRTGARVWENILTELCIERTGVR